MAEVTWPEEKRCSHCKRLKKAAEFYKDKSQSTGLAPSCKVCSSARTKEYWSRPDVQARHRERRRTVEGKAAARQARLKSKFGMTIEDYDRMLADQGGGCAICATRPTSKRRLNVDHDHSCCPGGKSCGKCVRGLLCGQCNLKILGYWLHEGSKGTDQAIGTAKRLVAYLERGSDARTRRAA